MKMIITIFLITLITYCASNNDVYASTYQDDYDALNKIQVTDGINETEAYIIAKAFFWSKISGCGFPEKPISKNGKWVSKTRIGYVGKQGESIVINKKTGTIIWGIKIITLEEILKSQSNNQLKRTPRTRAFFAKNAKKAPVRYAA